MSLPFDPDQRLIVIPVRLWGPIGDTVVRMAIDTGATSTVVGWEVAVLLGYDPAGVPGRVQMTTGSGVEFVPQIVIEKIEAVGEEQQDIPVLCHTLPPSATVDGLIA